MSGSKPKKPKPTEQERALAQRGASDWNDYVNKFAPVALQLAEDVRVGADDVRDLGTAVSSRAAQAFAGADSDLVRLRRAPGGAAGGANVIGLGDSRRSEARARGLGLAGGRVGLLGREQAGLAAVAASGRGVQSQGVQGMAHAGLLATDAAIAEELRRQEYRQGLISAVGSGIGMYGATRDWAAPKPGAER